MNTKHTYEYCRRKSDQCWDMAGLARTDGDHEDTKRLTQEAREWDRKASELRREG